MTGIKTSLVLLLGLASLPAVAAGQDCWIGLLDRPGSPTIDGLVGSEWSDASSLEGGSSCLGEMYDWDGATYAGTSPIPDVYAAAPRSLRVLSKRVGSQLYFLFDVEDHTDLDPDGSPLDIGEMLVLQIDPNHSRDSDQLGPASPPPSADYRIEIIYARDTNPPVVRFASSSATYACSVGTRRVYGTPGSNPAINAAATTTPTGYVVELSVPLSAIGSPMATGQLGLAFAVINDIGDNFATGATFPDGLPLTEATYGLIVDPAMPTGYCNDWIHPIAWGGAYFESLPGSVTISRLPVFWNSEDIDPRACDSPSYTYYPGHPCRLALDATVTNSGSTTRRNLLYLFGDRDAASVRWTAMDLREVNVPAGSSLHASDLFSPPGGLAAHPCVRVLILPASFHATFTRDSLASLEDAPHSLWTDIMSAYGLNDAHWAQKNISRWSDPSTACPVEGCGTDMGALPTGVGSRMAGVLNGLGLPSLTTPAAAQVSAQRPTPAQQDARRRIALTDEDWERYGRTDLIVQLATFGVAQQSIYQTPQYRFIEPLGGAIQLFPVDAVRQREGARVEIPVTNPDDYARLVVGTVSTWAPPGAEDLPIEIEFPATRMQPGATRTVRAAVGEAGGGISLPTVCNRIGAGSGLAVTLLLLGLVGVRSRRRD